MDIGVSSLKGLLDSFDSPPHLSAGLSSDVPAGLSPRRSLDHSRACGRWWWSHVSAQDARPWGTIAVLLTAVELRRERAGVVGLNRRAGTPVAPFSFVPVPHRLALVVTKHKRVGALHYLTCEDQVGTVLLDF